jgi:A/G-specific adenine glycosylase
MDFGATVCKPMSPLCSSCILKNTCAAFNQYIVGQLPLKNKVIQKKKRYFDYFCFKVGNQYWLQQRSAGDIWAGLHQFYLVEQEKAIPASEIYFKELLVNQLSIAANSIKIQLPKQHYQQQLTHQLLTVRFIRVEFDHIPQALQKGLWANGRAFKKYAFPKTINRFLEEEGL